MSQNEFFLKKPAIITLLFFISIIALPNCNSSSGAPVVVDDNYAWLGNTPLNVDAAQGLLANDQNVTSVSASDTETALGGTVTVNADGSFNYVPPLFTKGTDSFSYTATGPSGEGSAQVTIPMDALAWYVDNTAPDGGNGSLASPPFNNLADAQDAAEPGDYIIVLSGDGTSTGQDAGIVLQDNQSLIGQGIEVTFNGFTILPAGDFPVITSGFGIGVELANNNQVAGLEISETLDQPIYGNGIDGFNLHDNNILDNLTDAAIQLNDISGNGTIASNSFMGNPENAILLDTMGGSQLDLKIQSNNIDPSSTSDRLLFTASDDAVVTLEVSDNTINFNGGSPDGMGLTFSGNSQGSTIFHNNTINGENTSGRGMYVGSTDNAVLNQVISDNHIIDFGSEGMEFEGNGSSMHTVLITGNTIDNCSDGIRLGTGSPNQMTGVIEGNNSLLNNDIGIYISTTGTGKAGYRINDNSFEGNSFAGVSMGLLSSAILDLGINSNSFMNNVNAVYLNSQQSSNFCLQLQNNTSNNDYNLIQMDTSVFDLELPMGTNTGTVNEAGTINDVAAGTCDIPI